ncbi:tannase and feruloyl esterase [Daldinia vernicosa]|uniref:tannase and feruloyl esterase n=1 Tax=Daldinia vernicosa TaxID=114800 RepID=UPI002008E81C|nr:tannase and feruloyl esterase [Daldinia vernicosa]KAI0850124.1 tannase and feruloyl esterase [Daldinia vernicosa]
MCSPAQIPYPDLPGVQFTSLSASLVSNLTIQVPESTYTNNGAVYAEGVNFCNLTTTYTHPGESDTVTISVYLPTEWNGRMQGVGGGGFSAGGVNFPLLHYSMLGAVSEGYSAVTTNAGHDSINPDDWILKSPGHVDLHLLEEFGSNSLNELSIIGKAITESYYGKPPAYSYWNGCSQGGRQGFKIAEKYPTAFDGIAASAPAVDFAGLGVADHWPQVVMKALGQYPKNCEFVAITEAFIKHCDGNDGLLDGIVTDPDSCDFDPYSVVGKSVDCQDTDAGTVKISEAAANISIATWTGARKLDGSFLWWGLKRGASLVDEDIGLGVNAGLATTVCSGNGTCTGHTMDVVDAWIRLLIKKDPTFDVTTVTIEDLQDLFQQSLDEYGPIFNVKPNLDAFREAGGKLLSYHGLADAILPPDSSSHFYESVTAHDEQIHDYYRLFEAPGLAHCWAGSGGYYPAGLFKALVSWVESDVAPDSIIAATSVDKGPVRESILCPYPQKAHYRGTSSNATAGDFYCDN